MLEFKFDTQLLIDGRNLAEDEIFDYITKNIEGDCLLAVGDESLIKIHFHFVTVDYGLYYNSEKEKCNPILQDFFIFIHFDKETS